jgi:hypothetical protein
MARVVEDPEQQTHFGALIDEPDDDLSPEERLAPRTVVIGGETVRKGDKKPESRSNDGAGRGGEGELPLRASPEPLPEDEGIAELKRQLANQQTMTQRAAQVAQAEHQARIQAERGLATSNLSMVDQAIESAKRDSDQARAYFQNALDRGDHKGAADAQILASDARANLLRLMEMREGLGTEPPRGQPQPQPQPQRQQGYVDPAAQMQANVTNLSRHLDQTGFPKSAEWIRSHPEMVKDRVGINKVDGAHQYAVNTLGLIPETDGYFDKIEELLGVGEPQRETRDMSMTRQGQRQMGQNTMRSMAAPARAEAPSLRTGQRRGTPVSLTPRQREHARDVLGMTDEEYAAELLDATSRGKMLGARS